MIEDVLTVNGVDVRVFSDVPRRNLVVKILIAISIVYFAVFFLFESQAVGYKVFTEFDNIRAAVSLMALTAPQSILMLLLCIPLYFRRHVGLDTFQLSLIWLFFFVIGSAWTGFIVWAVNTV